MVCRSTCCGKSSRAKRRRSSTYTRTAPWPHHSNFTGCRSRDEWSLRLRVSYTDGSLQRRQRTCLLTFDSSPSMVVLISVHPLTEHRLFHGRAPASGTEVSRLPDRACETLWRLRYDRWPATDSSSDIWKLIYLQPMNHGASWRFFNFFLRHINTLTRSLLTHVYALYKCTLTLTLLLLMMMMMSLWRRQWDDDDNAGCR